MSKIQQSLEKLFEKHRIILWYDVEEAFTDDFEALDFKHVTKIRVEGNQFATKVRILHQEKEQSFLLYLPIAQPEDEDNWLLDVELANHVYYTDREALYLQEMGLGYHYRDWIQEHIAFFANSKRLNAFKELAKEADGDQLLTLKLLQVVFEAESTSLHHFLRKYASTFIQDSQDKLERDLKRFNLWNPFWELVSKELGYETAEPTIYDVLIESFQKSFSPLASKAKVQADARVMVSEWQDTLSFQEAFKELSCRIESDLQIEELLNDISLDHILKDDVFELIDQRILSELIQGILDQHVSRSRLEEVIKLRSTKYWYTRYQDFYEAVHVGYMLLEEVQQQESIQWTSLTEGADFYAIKGFKIDQYYRLFLQHYRATQQNRVLNTFYEAVNKAYSNAWLLKLGDAWQNCLEENKVIHPLPKSQHRFFQNHVQAYLNNNTRVFVVISDALRYECGEQIHQQILQENRFESRLDYQLAPLPSYTQLGMASLLPHDSLEMVEGKDEVLVNGMSTLGTQARKKILQKLSGVKATTILAEDLMKLPSRGEEARELVTQHELIYVYHNRIDKMGDDKSTEDKVIEAARDEGAFLMEVIKKIANMNGYHVVITADHGFIYQHDELAESDFLDVELDGEIYKKNRRFVLGKQLSKHSSMLHFKVQELGLSGEMEVNIPKHIQRLRVQGAGSRFVHGGASLQELMVPVLHVKKVRQDNVQKIEVDVLNKRNNRITTNIQRVNFYQQEAVGKNRLPRTLKIQFKGDAGEMLSDVFTYTFDADAQQPNQREVEHRFQIASKASTEFKNREIYLYLEEQVEGSNKWIEYAKYPYTVQISFTNDFDDF